MIAIGADHGGYELKGKIIEFFKDTLEFKDFGTNSSESTDYPKIAYLVADSVASGECDKGILICRTGVGMSIVANKVKGVRCALCYNEKVGKLCKEHNNANVISLPADMVTFEDVVNIIKNWLETEFAGGRHEARVNMIER